MSFSFRSQSSPASSTPPPFFLDGQQTRRDGTWFSTLEGTIRPNQTPDRLRSTRCPCHLQSNRCSFVKSCQGNALKLGCCFGRGQQPRNLASSPVFVPHSLHRFSPAHDPPSSWNSHIRLSTETALTFGRVVHQQDWPSARSAPREQQCPTDVCPLSPLAALFCRW